MFPLSSAMIWDKWMVLVVGVGWSWIGGRILKLRTFLMTGPYESKG